MLLSDGAGPVQEPEISVLTENAQAFTCLSSLPGKGCKAAAAAGERGAGGPTSSPAMLHGQLSSTGTPHVKASQEKNLPVPFPWPDPSCPTSSWTWLLAQPLCPSADSPGKLQMPCERQKTGMIKQNPLLVPQVLGKILPAEQLE